MPSSTAVYVGDQRLGVVDGASKQPRPIKSVIVPASEPSESPVPGGPELPYRTRVDYRVDDDSVPSQHVAPQPKPRPRDSSNPAAAGSSQQTTTSSAQLITVTSPRDAATRIQIGHRRDTDKHR